MATILEAVQELNTTEIKPSKKVTRVVKESKEDSKACPKCGKEVCECSKTEELNETTNSFINEFGIPTIDPEFEDMTEELTEDVETSMPVTPLSQEQILDFVHSDEKATAKKGPMGKVFKLGYIAEATDGMIAAQFRGGRGSINKETGEELPRVRVFKCTEYTGCYLENYSDSKVVKAARAGEEPGTSHERKGYTWVERGVFKKNGTELLALAPLMRTDFSVKRKFYLSIDGGDLVEASKDDIAQYCKPSALAPRPASADGGRPTFTFLFKGIYMLGNLGTSLI